MSLTTITVPSTYGYVILSSVIGTGFITSTYLGVQVMKARTKYNVQYPHMYATPGIHKECDAFNRVQRGHQAMFEQLTTFVLCSLIGGLSYPIATTIHITIYNIGRILFLFGYSDTTLDVKDARYKKGGQFLWFGYFGVMYCCVTTCGKIIGWW
jgi:glutathione S-transferase